jgi:hypothetical protein
VVRFPVGARDFSLRQIFQTGSGTKTASYAIGNGAVFPGLKRLQHEADRPLLSSFGVKND